MIYKAFLMFILPIVSILANENASAYTPKCQKISSTIIQIITEQSDSIQYFDGERLYLKVERICPTNNGLLLCNNHSSILLPTLFTDPMGYYLPCLKTCRMKCINPECKYCCWDAYKYGIECPHCEYPGDPA